MNCHARGCPPLRENSRACHCAACHETFSSLTLFDSHQERAQGWSFPVSCKTPGALGLASGPNGVWWVPEALKSSTERIAKANLGRAA